MSGLLLEYDSLFGSESVMDERVKHHRYDSLLAFSQKIGAMPDYASNLHRRNQYLRNKDELFAFWRNGWPEGTQRMRDALDAIETPQVMDRRRKPTWSDEGDSLDRDRLYGGETACWRRTVRQNRVQPRPVRVTIDVEAHVATGNAQLFWRGAAAVMLAESLAVSGYPVEIVATSGAAGMATSEGSHAEYISVTIKEFDGPVLIPQLVATTCNEKFLRQGVFAHNVTTMTAQAGYGLGYSVTTSTPDALRRIGLIEPGIITVSTPNRIISKEGAQAWTRGVVYQLEHPEDF